MNAIFVKEISLNKYNSQTQSEQKKRRMDHVLKRPTKSERELAKDSLEILRKTAPGVEQQGAVEFKVNGKIVDLPTFTIKSMIQILESVSKGIAVSIVPVATEVTTQAAAEYLNCSRPYIVKLLKEGKIPFTPVGRHRRILFTDLQKYKAAMKAVQKAKIIEMMGDAENLKIYDT
jgi:excisionase family DNA binding protein